MARTAPQTLAPPGFTAVKCLGYLPGVAPTPKQTEQLPVFSRRSRNGEVVVHLPVAWSQVGWGLTVTLCLGGLVWFAGAARAVSVPLIAALITAYVLNPLVDRMARQGLPRTVAIVGLLLAFLGGTVGLGLLVGPRVVQEAREVPDKLRQLLGVLRPLAQDFLQLDVPDSLEHVLATLQQRLRGQTPYAALAQRATEAARVVFGGTLSALASLGAVAVTPLFTFYFLRDFPQLKDQLRALWPHRSRPAMERTLREINVMLNSFVRGQLIVGAILAVLYVAGFYLVGLPLALLLGMVTGLGNMVPFVGTTVGLVFATLFSVLGWHGWAPLLMVWGVFVVNHMLESWLITPRVVGTQVGLSSFWVIVSVLSFGELFGFVGVLMAVPAAAVLKILAREALGHYWASRFYRGSDAPVYAAELKVEAAGG